jgi:tRNA threonylcarbamoyladenosine biosynthesis protein TsaE
MNNMKKYLENEEETERLGAELWALLPAKCVIFLQGELGAGKTTLVRGFLRAAGFSGTVKSPTYNLVEEYTIGKQRIFHFDLYRLVDPEELEWIGIRDYFDQGGICFIEWPDKGQGFLPEPDIVITLHAEGRARAAEMESFIYNIKIN